MWHKLACNPQEAVTGSVLGRLNVDSHERNRDRANLLKEALVECSKYAKLEHGLTWGYNNQVKIDEYFWGALASLDKATIKKTLSFSSTADRKFRVQAGPARELTFQCDRCTKVFSANAGLQTHKNKTHKVAHPLRSMVTTSTCPLCGSTFADIRGAQLHVQRVRAKKFTQEQIDERISNQHNHRSVGQDSQPTLHAFVR